MNKEISEFAKTHKVLTLQIRKENFLTILEGSQKVEHRLIYPSNQGMYILDKLESCTGNQLKPRPYDALYLINGRRQDAPRLLVEVEYPEFVIMKDKQGRNNTFVEKGRKYYDCQMWYHLGKVLAVENFEGGMPQPFTMTVQDCQMTPANVVQMNVASEEPVEDANSVFMKTEVKHNPICVFKYDITDDSDYYKTNGVGVQFSDIQLSMIASYIKANGGMENVTVEQLPRDIYHVIASSCQEAWEKEIEKLDVEPDGEFYMILHDELPLELKLACEAINNVDKEQ